MPATPPRPTREDLPLAAVIGAGALSIAVARRLAQTHRILVCDRSQATLDRLVTLLRDEGHDATGQICDVTDPGSVEAFAARAAALGPTRALAHVVGISPSLGDFRDILRVNLAGAVRMGDAMRPQMGRGAAAVFVSALGGHRIAITDEMAAVLADPLAGDFLDRIEPLAPDGTPHTAYRLSKAGLNRFCERSAAAWGAAGARIVSISPGLIASPMGALEFANPDSGKHALLARTPLGREATMPEIAEVIAFLLSPQASFISGTDILVDGGLIGALRS